MWFVLVGIVVIVALVVFKRRYTLLTKKRADKVKGRINQSRTNAYRAVSVSSSTLACAGALKLKDKNFLVREAPELPLTGCSAANCRCRYNYHADRRSSEDRRLSFGAQQNLYSLNSERRERHDRRKAA
jgi:hypothetical protein